MKKLSEEKLDYVWDLIKKEPVLNPETEEYEYDNEKQEIINKLVDDFAQLTGRPIKAIHIEGVVLFI